MLWTGRNISGGGWVTNEGAKKSTIYVVSYAFKVIVNVSHVYLYTHLKFVNWLNS